MMKMQGVVETITYCVLTLKWENLSLSISKLKADLLLTYEN